MIRNNQNRRRRGGNNGPRPQQMGGGNNYGNRLDNRQRGNASQLLEKYRALARDAQQAGDRVTAEYYLQYADHYYRVLGDYRDKQPEQGRQRGREFYDDENTGYAANGDDADGGDEDGDDDRADNRADDGRDDVRVDNRQDNRQDNRAENRSDARPDTRNDSREDNRSNWREDRSRGDRNFRDGNREPRRDAEGNRDGNREPRRDAEGNRDGNRDVSRDVAQREPRRDNDAPRDRQPYAGDRNRDRDRNDRRDRPERRPDSPRPAFEAGPVGEGPIPGLPGPATLRVNRTVEPSAEAPVETVRAPRAPRAERAPRPETTAAEAPATLSYEAAPVADAGDAAAPRRRGRPRKIVAELPIDG